ncbi:hypothetical protein ACS127_03575 [Amphibacillus sp. Q70]|uniref:hypothetical protein n=1 Tax=Amphibacillus sp. Q70 TaxID=3453416 RepID=UPI003F8733A4
MLERKNWAIGQERETLTNIKQFLEQKLHFNEGKYYIMKRFMKFLFLNMALVAFIAILVGCGNNPEGTEADSENGSAPETETEADDQEEMNHKEDDESPAADSSENDLIDENEADAGSISNNSISSNETESIDDDALSAYSSEEIEYARVWLQMIGNQDIEELNVSHTSAGEQVNPYDDDSVDFPENVITLQGQVMAEGTVTYSGNGDGTINLYELPSHWPSHEQIDEPMEEYTENIINSTERIYIETGNDEEIVNIIDKLSIR